MALGEVDGELVVIILNETDRVTPFSVIRLRVAGERIVGITDYIKRHGFLRGQLGRSRGALEHRARRSQPSRILPRSTAVVGAKASSHPASMRTGDARCLQIDFYFDFLSPYSYLASIALPRLAAEHAATISYRPFGLLDLMKIVGNRPTTLESKNKGDYAMADLQRWAKRYHVAFAPSPFWQCIDFAELGAGLIVASDEGRAADYVNAVYPAVYGDRAISASVPN